MADIAQYTSAGGCACKLSARDLSQVLDGRSLGEFGVIVAFAFACSYASAHAMFSDVAQANTLGRNMRR